MDPTIAIRLDDRKGNEFYDSTFAGKMQQLARNYIDAGVQALNYHIADFDAVTDLVEMYAPVESAANFEKLDRNAAINMRHPMTFIEMVTLTTFIAQILFGGEQARSVDAQGEDDQQKADDVNALLAYNDSKLGIYLQGWLWIWMAVVYNRGVWYESTDQDVTVEREPVEEDDLSKPKVPALKADGSPRMRGGKPVMEFQKRIRYRNKRTRTGFYNKLDIVSPYDFICDPELPLLRFQEGRFAGHRVMIPWYELKRRSELDPSDDQYVLPGLVRKMKENSGRGTGMSPTTMGSSQGANSSRTYYERQKQMGTVSGSAATIGGGNAISKDGGVCECYLLQVRAKPKTLDMYDDDDFEIIQILANATGEILSAQVRPNKHDEFTYACAEGFPSAVRQFSPGFGLKIKPCQDRVDDLNLTHSNAQKRMGNILLIDDAKCDVNNLLSRDKNGLMIMRKLEGKGVPPEECVYQIPLKDTTAGYNDEMAMWVKIAENTTGAHAFVQGQTEDPSQTLGQFDAVKQMAVGRISSVARMISEQALKPQTRRFVCNYQQFAPETMVVRVIGKGQDFDPETPPEKWRTVEKANIQGSFDVVAHDGALPGADNRIVAALARTIEVFGSNPILAPGVDMKRPGAINLVEVAKYMLKKGGAPIGDMLISREQAQINTRYELAAQGMPQPPPPEAQPGLTPPTDPATGAPSTEQLPPAPTAAPPALHPGNI